MRGEKVPKMTVARAMVECLKKEGVKHIFGYPGAAICPFYNELQYSEIEHILVRHEVNAGHAASGYARISGRPGVCVATSGPGATNLITAIATAYMDSVPMIAITGQVICEQIGRDSFQEADITGAAEPFVKHSFLVKNASEIATVMKRAFYIASTGRPGPVLVDVPMDIQETEIDFEYPETVEIRSYKPNVNGNMLQIKRAMAALQQSKCPLICAGGGIFAANAQKELLKISELCDIPVVSTMMGIGSISTSHPNYLGMIGMYGKKLANTALQSCDLLILLGARVGDRAVVALKSLENTTVVHIDIDPAEIGKNVAVNIPVVGDIKNILNAMLEIAEPQTHFDWRNMLKTTIEPVQDITSNKNYVNPRNFIEKLNTQLPKDAVITADVGSNLIWTARNISIDGDGRFLTSGGMGTMGYSLPAAIGAKKANPDKEVIAICGDGSFQMQFMELATAMQYGINVKIIVMVNNCLGMVREYQEEFFNGKTTAVTLDGSPDYMKIAEAYGIKSQDVHNDAEAGTAISDLLKSQKPYLLQVFVDENENSIIY